MAPNSWISRNEFDRFREEFDRKLREQKTDGERALELACAKLVTEDAFMPVRRTVYGVVWLFAGGLVAAIWKLILLSK